MPLLTVSNNVYDYPEPSREPGWGEEATAWAQAVTDVLNTLLGPGDILETSFVIGNNVSVVTNINGMSFDGAAVRAANVTYTVIRRSDETPSGNTESGTLRLTYDPAGTIGNKWKLSQLGDMSAGMVFSVTDAGQVQYKSTDIGSTNYQGQIKFIAKTLSQ